MVFFSKRRKNNSLCHHHTAPCLIPVEITSFYMQAPQFLLCITLCGTLVRT
ncbi:hypothetical protein MtrunA17_Chr1g0199291 [Medicago truncatula]|uniref:Uncharacterized protein n=1 Tax=Medicago truncatula TaxID=3880 RepID=A0A396JT14_MEDTR|nr:hypothetical protein MtrunA17_Chr1g0199291 [Medicago truncatula]